MVRPCSLSFCMLLSTMSYSTGCFGGVISLGSIDFVELLNTGEFSRPVATEDSKLRDVQLDAPKKIDFDAELSERNDIESISLLNRFFLRSVGLAVSSTLTFGPQEVDEALDDDDPFLSISFQEVVGNDDNLDVTLALVESDDSIQLGVRSAVEEQIKGSTELHTIALEIRNYYRGHDFSKLHVRVGDTRTTLRLGAGDRNGGSVWQFLKQPRRAKDEGTEHNRELSTFRPIVVNELAVPCRILSVG